MYGTPEFKRVIQYIWDPEPQNADHQNEIVCLGNVYSPVFKTTDAIDTAERADDTKYRDLNNEGNVDGDDEKETDDLTNDHSHDDSGSADKKPSAKQPSSTPSSPSTKNQTISSWPPEFLSDVDSKLWFTYRTSFPVIPCSHDGPSSVSISRFFRGSGIDLNGFTSDVGWGCMIRTSQSLLANCIITLQLGRDWRRPQLPKQNQKPKTTASHYMLDATNISSKNEADTGRLDRREAEITSMFADHPDCLFSVHNFVKHGEASCGKKPGQWFGPSAAASSIKALHEQRLANQQEPKTTRLSSLFNTSAYESCFKVFISSGSDVYEKLFMQAAITKDNIFKPTLILLGLRLGIDKVNEIYWDSIKAFLASPQAMGISGGRPSSSHYFYGYQGNNLFYLDPHHPRPALDPFNLTEESIETIHTKRIRYLHLSEMDPSMLMGVLIKDEDDWKSWKHNVQNGPLQSIIHISQEPIDPRKSSVSIPNDDDFIDVTLEPEYQYGLGYENYPEDSEVIVGSPNENTFSKVSTEEGIEPSIMVNKNFGELNSSSASILDISTTSGGQIRTRSITGATCAPFISSPDALSVNELDDSDLLQMDASTLSLATESAINLKVSPAQTAKYDASFTTPTSSSPINLSAVDLNTSIFADNKNNNSKQSNRDKPVLITQTMTPRSIYGISSVNISTISGFDQPSQSSLNKVLVGSVDSSDMILSSGEEIESYGDEDNGEEERSHSRMPNETADGNIENSDLELLPSTSSSPSCNFSWPDSLLPASQATATTTTNSSRYDHKSFLVTNKNNHGNNMRTKLHRDSDSSYHDIGVENSPLSIIKSGIGKGRNGKARGNGGSLLPKEEEDEEEDYQEYEYALESSCDESDADTGHSNDQKSSAAIPEKEKYSNSFSSSFSSCCSSKLRVLDDPSKVNLTQPLVTGINNPTQGLPVGNCRPHCRHSQSSSFGSDSFVNEQIAFSSLLSQNRNAKKHKEEKEDEEDEEEFQNISIPNCGSNLSASYNFVDDRSIERSSNGSSTRNKKRASCGATAEDRKKTIEGDGNTKNTSSTENKKCEAAGAKSKSEKHNVEKVDTVISKPLFDSDLNSTEQNQPQTRRQQPKELNEHVENGVEGTKSINDDDQINNMIDVLFENDFKTCQNLADTLSLTGQSDLRSHSLSTFSKSNTRAENLVSFGSNDFEEGLEIPNDLQAVETVVETNGQADLSLAEDWEYA